jgi:alpha-L-glutamate ligase-like protein
MIARILTSLKGIRDSARKVLTMNQRNLHYIYPNNHRRYFPIADNKMLTKEFLKDAPVSVPETLKSYGSFYEMRNLERELAALSDFVIKPAKGSGGGGIIVITKKEKGLWYSAGGKPYAFEELKRHITDIIFGVYSFGLDDTAIIEQRVIQHPFMEKLSPMGLADIRIILHQNNPVMCMSRIPTRHSDGKANLKQGAVGVGIDILSGVSEFALLDGSFITRHPDTCLKLVGRSLPYWREVMSMSQAIAEHVPLKYLGVDIAFGLHGPVLLEINVRPGLKIQNVNQTGMREILEELQGSRS